MRTKYLIFTALFVCAAAARDREWPVREQQTLEKTLALAGPPMRLVVDNIEGYVHIRAVDGSKVHVVAQKTVRAETDSDLAESREVKLTMEEKPGTVTVYYDAPWRCNGYGGNCHGDHRRFYDVQFDIDVEVPRAARIVASTVTSGDVALQNTGDFDVSNVNGAIRMSGITGAGDGHTVNGPITIHFARNPSAECHFKTVNGSLDAFFSQPLSADLVFQTMNGEIFSDFDVAPRTMPAAVTERRGGKYIYRSNRARGGRAGNGGPELSFQTLNGSIRLHREQ